MFGNKQEQNIVKNVNKNFDYSSIMETPSGQCKITLSKRIINDKVEYGLDISRSSHRDDYWTSGNLYAMNKEDLYKTIELMKELLNLAENEK